MERLTKRDADGQAVMDCQKCKADWTGKHGKPMEECTALYCRDRVKDRLAEYEDPGLMLISRRPPQQKFTNFEEYMTAHGGATAPIEDHTDET